MLKTRRQKVSEEKRTTLDVELHRNLGHDEDPAERGNEKNGTDEATSKRIYSGRTRTAIAISTGTIDLKKKSELSKISIEKPVLEGSITDHTMMQGVAVMAAKSSSFSERVENTPVFFPFTMRTETGDEVSTQEEDDDYEEIEEFESQLSFSSSTHEDVKPVSVENSSSDQFLSL